MQITKFIIIDTTLLIFQVRLVSGCGYVIGTTIDFYTDTRTKKIQKSNKSIKN